MEKIFLKIISPMGVLFEDYVRQIEFKTPNGYIGILKDHAPLIASIVPSLIYIKDEKGHRESGLINKGIANVTKEKVTILTDFFQFSKDVNESIIDKRVKKMTEKISKQKSHDQQMYDKILIQIEKEANNLKKLSKK